jgi:proteasome lid subunit RPN8/RPN11
MTQPFDGDLECWRPPQFSFQILYSRLILEQIRLAVADAYFLVPRGGLEIGGVLLGKHRDRQVEVLDHEPLGCEHAFGPSFLLSPRDQERLQDLLAKARHKSSGLETVGWYHSHTRSEICLTESDLDIHNRHFPAMWQVALVLRPSTSEPTRAGFFFRESGGSIRASASYHEFKLEPQRSGSTLLKTEPDAQFLRGKGESKAIDPVIALPRPEARSQPAAARLQRPVPERPAAPANSRPPSVEPVLAPAASRPAREGPVPLTMERPVPRERPLKPAVNPQPPERLPAVAADMRPVSERLDRSLTPSAPPRLPREGPAPLTSIPERLPASTERPSPLDPTPARVVRAVRIAAPVAIPQPKPEREATPIVVSPPVPKRQAAEAPVTPPAPETTVIPPPVKRVDPGPHVELPRFLREEPPRQAAWTRVPLLIATMLCLAIALGGFAFVARDAVSHSLRAFTRRASTSRAASLPLRIGPAMSINAVDTFGQLQIRWDTSSPSVQAARSGVLSIVDGGPPQRIPLDGPHVQAGTFTYKRNGARVDARLSILTAEGSSVEAATTFLGPPPVEEAEPAPAKAPAGSLAKQNAQLRRQLDDEIARNKTLQAQLDRLRKQRPKKTGP